MCKLSKNIYKQSCLEQKGNWFGEQKAIRVCGEMYPSSSLPFPNSMALNKLLAVPSVVK